MPSLDKSLYDAAIRPSVSMATGEKFCPYCGASNPAEYQFCANCRKQLPTTPAPTAEGTAAAAVAAAAPVAGSAESLPAPPKRPHRKLVYAILAIVLALTVILNVIYLVPISTNFTLNIPSGGTEQKTYPNGANVKFNWAASNGQCSDFELSTGGQIIYSAESTGGSYSFNSYGGAYTYNAALCTFVEESFTVTVSGSYSATLSQSAVNVPAR